jgi:hypothetical protein
LRAEPQQREKSTISERFMHRHGGSRDRYSWKNEVNVNDPSVNINASYIEALLGKKLIRCKIYFYAHFSYISLLI